MESIPVRVIERFWERVEILDEDSCWNWKLSCGSHGYGQIGWWEKSTKKSVVVLSHRLSYNLSKGKIPINMTVDHICHVRKCCNPNHLRLLTNIENASDNGANKRKETLMKKYGTLNTHRLNK